MVAFILFIRGITFLWGHWGLLRDMWKYYKHSFESNYKVTKYKVLHEVLLNLTFNKRCIFSKVEAM